MGWLVNTSPTFDLAQSHKPGIRVLFVGGDTWGEINRVISKRFGDQQVKQHGNWMFVLNEKFEPSTVIEVPSINWWMNGRHNKRLLRHEAADERIGKDTIANTGNPVNRVN